mmetsp:Transcript_5111/g.11959  ORF Transcript_5111/g.11959 Transcript_5111/m.11959 type:complete len:297 (-) Transcript_5111:609-1499(-)
MASKESWSTPHTIKTKAQDSCDNSSRTTAKSSCIISTAESASSAASMAPRSSLAVVRKSRTADEHVRTAPKVCRNAISSTSKASAVWCVAGMRRTHACNARLSRISRWRRAPLPAKSKHSNHAVSIKTSNSCSIVFVSSKVDIAFCLVRPAVVPGSDSTSKPTAPTHSRANSSASFKARICVGNDNINTAAAAPTGTVIKVYEKDRVGNLMKFSVEGSRNAIMKYTCVDNANIRLLSSNPIVSTRTTMNKKFEETKSILQNPANSNWAQYTLKRQKAPLCASSREPLLHNGSQVDW